MACMAGVSSEVLPDEVKLWDAQVLRDELELAPGDERVQVLKDEPDELGEVLGDEPDEPDELA